MTGHFNLTAAIQLGDKKNNRGVRKIQTFNFVSQIKELYRAEHSGLTELGLWLAGSQARETRSLRGSWAM